MTSSSAQVALAALVGIAIAVVAVRLSRRGRLSFRYTLGWIGVASVGILAGVLVPLTIPIASALGLSPAALLALLVFILLLAISIQLSISISGIQRQSRVLAEEIARLQHDVKASSLARNNARTDQFD